MGVIDSSAEHAEFAADCADRSCARFDVSTHSVRRYVRYAIALKEVGEREDGISNPARGCHFRPALFKIFLQNVSYEDFRGITRAGSVASPMHPVGESDFSLSAVCRAR